MDIVNENQQPFGIHFAHGKGYSMNYFHYHNEYELFIIDTGGRSIIIKDAVFNLSKFDVGLVSSNTFHRTAGPAYSRTIVYFSPQFLEQYFTPDTIERLTYCFYAQALHLTQDEYLYVKKKIRHMQNEDIKDPNNKIYLLLGDILSLFSKKASSKDEPMPSESDTLISQALNYINLHYNTINSLDEIANSLFVTKCHLCRVFKKVTSSTINDYITSLRLKHACELLISSNKSIAQISTECGFNSPIYFTQCFKKHFSVTPATFRKQEQQEK